MQPRTPDHHDRRWLILAVIGIAQLLVVLDVTIVNIALPSAQRELGFSDDERQWVITAYALTFGSLLLVGGRVADLFGRRGLMNASAFGRRALKIEPVRHPPPQLRGYSSASRRQLQHPRTQTKRPGTHMHPPGA